MNFKLILTSLGLALLSNIQAAVLDHHIQQLLNQPISQVLGKSEVIVTFKNQDDAQTIMPNFAAKTIYFTQLPMAAAQLSVVDIASLDNNDRVLSIYSNQGLSYSNFTSGQITGGHYVHDNYGVYGEGVTIAVLDSGVDASHPDLALGEKTVENVKIVGDLGLAGGVNLFVEGVLNSDTTSGHGTHVAGTTGGNGMASASDERRPFYMAGIAPKAKLVGLGAGEGISILYALLGFEYAIANQERLNIDIITNSWGGGDGSEFDPYDPINIASFMAYQKGMVVSFAASNSGPDEDTLNKYAVAPWVINVAAGTADKSLADFSSRGVAGHPWKSPDVTAPGNLITSTRAPNTAIGAMGPVNDPNHPEYTLRYHSISGTSMATPFVAGTAALLLGANPNLSPDQVENIIKLTADPMPGYQMHEVGTGYINVKAAVDLAKTTQGSRRQFLDGDTEWASKGLWTNVEEGNGLLQYAGRWVVKSDNNAIGGKYIESQYGANALSFYMSGKRLKFNYISKKQGGIAEVIIDGQSYGTINAYSSQVEYNKNFAINELSDQIHFVEIRSLYGKMMIDGIMIDGQIIDNNITYVDETLNSNGTMGPSAENTSIHEIEFIVDASTVAINAVLTWDSVADLDFYLVDPEGNEVASSATLENPEKLSYWVDKKGKYRFRVTGYISALTNYQIVNTMTKQQPK